VPTLRTAIREHLKATALSLRTIAIIVASLGVLATLLVFSDFIRGRGGVEFAPELSMIPAFAGLLLPVAMWPREKLFDGGHIWTLPVDRSRNAFAKFIAGWMILMAAVAVFTLWLLVLALITKGNITGDEVIKVLPPGFKANEISVGQVSGLDPSMLRTVTWIPDPLYWLVPFTAATGMYAIASGIMIGLKHPFRWVAGAFAAILLLGGVGQIAGDPFWNRARPIIDGLMYGRYGLDGLLTARTESLHTVVTLTGGKLVRVWYALPTISDWVIATLLWTSLGIAGFAASLFRHRETR
jgi:hypothetical protein